MWWRRKRVRPTRLVVGLGNPGPDYAGTRHNVGAMALECFAHRHGAALDQARFRSRYGVASLGEGVGETPLVVGLLAPQTFMNRSGEAVGAALAAVTLAGPEQLLVITDDVDLPFGRLRLRPGGGPGGHRGLADIIDRLGQRDFPRLRIGVGRPPGGGDTAEHVLEPFGESELGQLPELLERACDALDCALGEGVAQAMNRYNRDSGPQGQDRG